MRGKICLSMISLLVLGIACSSEARVDSLTGGLDIGLDIDHRNNKNTGNTGTVTASTQDNDINRIITTPSLSFKSEDIKDSFEFKYAPGLKYDLDGKGNDVDHNLSFSAQRMLVKEWQIKISDLYVNTDDSTQTANTSRSNGENSSGGVSNGSSDQVSNQLGRRRFWKNDAALISKYTYLEDSLVSLGYTYSELRNNDTSLGGYQDYDKHDGSLSISYRLNPEWKATLGGEYIRGLFGVQNSPTVGISGDLVQYVGNMTIESFIFAKNPLALAYAYTGTKYDEVTRHDSDIHQAILSWKPEVSAQMKLDLGGGPSYEKTEGQAANWGYNAHAKLNYTIEHGNFGFGVEKAYGQDNFSGTSDGSFFDYWNVKGDFTYELYKDFSCSLFASYRDEDHKNALVSSADTSGSIANSNLDNYNKKIYETGVKMKYTFWRWFSATAGYTFSRQNSDNSTLVDFDEHRVYLTLGAEKELLRW